MPRNMSFFYTVEPFKNKTKTVTRRTGWKFLKPGDILMGCEKTQGIKKGGLNRLGLIMVVKVNRELLGQITDEDVVKEGFPEMDRYSFVDFFIKNTKPPKGAAQPVTRIEFKYIQRDLGMVEVVRIQGIDYPVKLESEKIMGSAVGLMHSCKTEIEISDANSHEHAKSVLIHEIIEALNYRLEIGLKHRQIIQLEAGIFEVLTDNPELVEYLSEPDPEEEGEAPAL